MTKRDMRSFLGTVGYYRKFIQGFAKHAWSLTKSTKKTEPRLHSGRRRGTLTFRTCVLNVPLCSDMFLVQTDASVFGVSGVLSVCRDGAELPVGFFSRQLREAETRYSASELECLAVVETIRHFEVYLHGRQFRVETDHKTLESLLSSKVLNGQLTRWALFLQEFQVAISYRPGSRNGNADGLSRQAWEGVSRPDVNEDVHPPECGGDVGVQPDRQP